MLRASAVPNGVCANCSVTEFLMNSYPLNMQLEEYGPEILLHPGMTEQFAPLMEVNKAQARPEEIDWQTVVRNWHLPVKVRRSPTNPWSPGEALELKLEEMEYMRRPSPMDQLQGRAGTEGAMREKQKGRSRIIRPNRGWQHSP